MKVILCIFSIVSLVVGAGFISGKEITTFYSRFGFWSIPSIVFSFFLFWFLFDILLNFNEKTTKNSKKTLFFQVLSLIISFIFASSMFASFNNLTKFNNKIISFLLFAVMILLCYLIFKNGLGSLKKINLIFTPLAVGAIIVCFFVLFNNEINLAIPKFEGYSIIYGIFYCTLNVSNGSFVLMSLGGNLTKKQKARVSFFSALVLATLLFAVNFVLLQNPQSFSSEMPLLSLCEGQFKSAMNLIVLFGSLTSLLSLIYTSSSLIRGLCKNEFLNFLISVLLPCLTGLLGFSRIVIYLYPIASVLGIILMGEIFIKKFIKKNKI